MATERREEVRDLRPAQRRTSVEEQYDAQVAACVPGYRLETEE